MKRYLLILGCLLASALPASAQYYRMDFSLQNAQGQAISGATVTVYNQSACGSAATTLATIYPAATGGTPISGSQVTTDGFGHAYAYMAAACYTVVYYSQYTGTLTYADQGPNGFGAGAYVKIAGDDMTGGLTTNKVISVTSPAYGAKCDGVTDDSAAIQSALDAAFTGTESVYIPSGCYVASTLLWKGQPIFGASKETSFLKGAPGIDVLSTPDSAVTLNTYGSIHDLTIEVDNSVNAAATAAGGNNTYPNRVTGTAGGLTALTTPPAPGPIVFTSGISGNCTGSISSSSTALTVTCGQFTSVPASMLVGQPITVTGAGSAGGTLTTTVASVTSGTVLALTAAASTTSATATVTIGNTNSMPAPWYIGNCGIAFPASSGAAMSTGLNGWVFRNLQIVNVNGANDANLSCGIFTQAANNNLVFENVDIQNLYGGMIEAPPFSNNTFYYAWTPDTNSYKNVNLKFNILPVVWYNGSHRTVNGMSIYGGNKPFSQGAYWFSAALGSSGAESPSGSIAQYYDECWTPNTGEHARFSGSTVVSGGSLAQCNGTSYVNWLGSQGTEDAQIGTSLQVAGNSNTFLNTGLSSTEVTNTGVNNKVLSMVYGSDTPSTAYGAQVNLNRQQGPVNQIDGGFLLSGNYTSPYTSGSDLLITCPQFNFMFQPTLNGCTADPSGTEITKSYAHLLTASYTAWNLSTATSQGNGPYGKYLTIGDRLPQAKVAFAIQGQCDVSCTNTITIKDITTSTTLATLSATFGTSWTIQTVPIDMSALALGDVIGVSGGAIGGGAAYLNIAWMGFSPLPIPRSSPTIVCGTGAGTSPSVCTITGNDRGGEIAVTTGTAPANAGTIATITLNKACPTKVYPVIRSSNANAASLSGNTHEYPSNFTASTWTITANATGLAATTAYTWVYVTKCN